MADDLRNKVEKTISGIDELHAGFCVDLKDPHARLTRVEQQADASREEHLAVRSRENEWLAIDARGVLSQIVESWHA